MNEIARMQQCGSARHALVDRVIRLGFAERLSDPDDRRSFNSFRTQGRPRECLDRFRCGAESGALEALAPLE